MITVRGLTQLKAKLARFQAEAEGRFATIVERKVSIMLADVLRNTPQYTGNLATNWYISLGDNPSYSPIATYVGPESWKPISNPYSLGHETAVSTAYTREVSKLSNLRNLMFKGTLRQIRLVNTAPYATQVEKGIGPNGFEIREANRRDYSVIADMMKGYIVTKYGKLKYKGF